MPKKSHGFLFNLKSNFDYNYNYVYYIYLKSFCNSWELFDFVRVETTFYCALLISYRWWSALYLKNNINR